MARLFSFFLVLCLLLLGCFSPSSDARKLLNDEKTNRVTIPAALEDSLVLNALPKGTVTPSAPGKKGHAVVIDEKLFAIHLKKIDRILRSVPSPGVGH